VRGKPFVVDFGGEVHHYSGVSARKLKVVRGAAASDAVGSENDTDGDTGLFSRVKSIRNLRSRRPAKFDTVSVCTGAAGDSTPMPPSSCVESGDAPSPPSGMQEQNPPAANTTLDPTASTILRTGTRTGSGSPTDAVSLTPSGTPRVAPAMGPPKYTPTGSPRTTDCIASDVLEADRSLSASMAWI
jgi:hypothetical protein